jgi:arylformamidase
MSWIDISTPLRGDMLVWPGDDPVRVEQTLLLDRGDTYNLTFLAMSAHTGTHIDAPRHFLREGAGIETMPLDVMMGPARVVDVDDPEAVHAHDVPGDLQPGDRVLFRTRNSTEYLAKRHFVEPFIYVARDAAQALADAGVALVGIDYLSIGGFHADLVETHEILLGAGVWVVEGIVLTHVQAGDYVLACMPLLIPGADGAPARAMLIKR